MKATTLLLLALLPCLLVLPTRAEDPIGQKTFNQPPDVLWPALLDVLVELQYPVKTMDRTTYFLNTDPLIIDDAHAAKKKIATGPKVFLGVWSQLNVSVQIKLTPKETGTLVTIVTNIQGFEGNMTGSWYKCPSNGTLEQVIFEHLDRRLRDAPAASLDPTASISPPGAVPSGASSSPGGGSIGYSVSASPPPKPLANEDIIKMVKAQLAPDLIITKIASCPSAFDTSTDGIIALSQAEVPKEIIKSMIEATKK